jgi:hypothetical protein
VPRRGGAAFESERRVCVTAIASALLLCAQAAGQLGPSGGRLFDPPVYYSLSAGPNPVNGFSSVDCNGRAVFGDFNGDGLTDIAFGTSLRQLGVALASSPGVFPPATLTAVAGALSFPTLLLELVGVGDFDLDGDIDIVGVDGAGLRLFLNNGMGVFASIPAFSPAFVSVGVGGVTGMIVADVDGDGASEVVLSQHLAFVTSIYIVSYSTLTGLLFTSNSHVVGILGSPLELGNGDFDGDGADDIFLSLQDSIAPTLQHGLLFSVVSGVGVVQRFATSNAVLGLPYLGSFFLGDMNLDGFCDIVAHGLGSMHLLLGGSTAQLSLGPASSAGAALPSNAGGTLGVAGFFGQPSRRSIVRDFDLDGFPDIGMPGFGDWGTIRSPLVAPIFNITLQDYVPVYFPAIHSTYAVDLDGDGDQDLIDVVNLTEAQIGLPPPVVANSYAHYGVFWNRTNRHQGCAPAPYGTVPVLRVGTPSPGNANWTLGISGALPGTPVAFALSLAPGKSTWATCDLWLDCSPSVLLLPTLGSGYATTDVLGSASITLSIPAAGPGFLWLENFEIFGAALAMDPNGSLKIGQQAYVSTQTRGILIW